MKLRLIFMALLLLTTSLANSQSVEINGKIVASVEEEGIHIINKTANRFGISNSDGEFTIPATLNDTILFSGISYKTKEIVVNKSIIASKQLTVYLEELVNALDEVIVGKVLTGDLLSDINNANVETPINFYDLGIPGYTGKLKTQTERRLYEATSGGGLIPLGPIINAITGRTKRLKQHVKLEKLESCMDKVKTEFSEQLFQSYPLEETLRTEFFYFCADDPEIEKLCQINNKMATFEFLVEKLEVYKERIEKEKH